MSSSGHGVILEVVGSALWLVFPQVLGSWRPFKEVLKPRPGKVPRRVLRKVLAQKWGAKESAEKVLRVPLLCRRNICECTGSTFFGAFLGTAFGTRHFPEHSSRHFLAWGSGTSLNGRFHNNFARECATNPGFSEPNPQTQLLHPNLGDALKGSNLRGTNAHLRFSAAFCENLRFPNA